jgi:hypothetical protein
MIRTTLLLSLVFALSACDFLPDDRRTTQPTDATLRLQVRAVSGEGLAEATATVETAEAVTNRSGLVELPAPLEAFELTVVAPGYRSWQGRVQHPGLEELNLVVYLEQEHIVVLEDAAVGGRVEGRDGLAVSFGPGVIVDAQGNAVAGPVDVVWALHDHENSVAALPGAVVQIHGDEDQPLWRAGIHGDEDQPLVSFGAASIELWALGEQLGLGPDGAFLELPLTGSAADASPALFHYAGAGWAFTDTVDLETNSSGGTTMGAGVPHFSTWGALADVETGCIRGRLLDDAGAPLVGAPIKAIASDPAVLFETRTDTDGRFAVGAPTGLAVSIRAEVDGCAELRTEPILVPPGATTCDGAEAVDLGDLVASPDADGDGFTTCQGDCDDSDSTISPEVAETCFDGIDQDCRRAPLPVPVVTATEAHLEAESFCAGEPGTYGCSTCIFESVRFAADNSEDPAGAGLRFSWHLLQAPEGTVSADSGEFMDLQGMTLSPTEPGRIEEIVKVRAVAESCDGASVGTVVYVTLECSAESG